MIKYLVFDFDGTLADTFNVVCDEGNKLLARYNIFVDVDEARRIGLKKILLKSCFPVLDIPKCLVELRTNIRTRVVNDVKTFSGMHEVIRDLSQKYTLAVVSSNAEANIRGFLENNSLAQYFQIIYSDSALFGKHRILKHLCKKFHLDYHELLYVGDEDRDIQAAKRSNIKSIAVSWGYNTANRLSEEKPDGLVDEPHELLNMINKF